MFYSKLLKLLFTFALVFSFIACQQQKSDPKSYSEVINKDNLSTITKFLKNDKDITTEDLNYLRTAIRYYSPIQDSLFGKTVGELIKSQKERDYTNSFNNLKSASFNIASDYALTFGIKEFQRIDEEGRKINLFTYTLSNKSEKDIKSIIGAVDFMNPQNQLVKRFTIEIDKEIPVGKVLNQPYPYPHDDENNRDQIIRNNLNQLRPVWKPTLIEFSDGSKIELNDLDKVETVEKSKAE